MLEMRSARLQSPRRMSLLRPHADPLNPSRPVVPPPVPAPELDRGALVRRGVLEGVLLVPGALSGGADAGADAGQTGWQDQGK